MHTHLLPRGWPSLPGVDLKLTEFKDDPEQFGEKIPFEKSTGFTAQMEWRSTGKLFRKCRQNLFDWKEVIRDCDSFGVDLQVACTVPVMFNYQLDPTIGCEWSRFLNQDLGRVCGLTKRMVGLGTLPLQSPVEAAKELSRAVVEDGICCPEDMLSSSMGARKRNSFGRI